jgi:DNA-binding transcriptional MocR family regulator
MEREVDLPGILGDWMATSGPLWRNLAAALEKAVENGDLAGNFRLPSERELARRLAVSRGTVVAAYNDLRARGVLDSRQGSGTRVRPGQPTPVRRPPDGRAVPLFRRLVDGPGEVISLAQAVDPVPDSLRAAAFSVVRDDLAALTADAGYHPRGLPSLRAAIASGYTALGLPTTSDQVLVTTGASQAISLAARHFVRAGSTVVTEAPGWPGCLDVFRAAGARVVGLPLDADGMQAEPLAAALRALRPALVFVTPTYQNPTGTLMSAQRRRRIVELTGATPLMEDSAHQVLGAPGVLPIAGYPGGVVLSVGSLAKSVWPGLRIGWIRTDAAIVDQLAHHKALADLGSSVIDQAIAARLLPQLPTLAEQHAAYRREQLDHITGLLRRYLPDWRWSEPDGGSALWIELPDTDAAVYAQRALRCGIEVVPGAATDPDGNHDSFLRLPFTFSLSTLDEIVHRLQMAWR